MGRLTAGCGMQQGCRWLLLWLLQSYMCAASACPDMHTQWQVALASPCPTCHSPLCAGSQPRRADGPYAELLPWLLEQAADWDVAATANVTGETPLVRVSVWVRSRSASCGAVTTAGELYLIRGSLSCGCHDALGHLVLPRQRSITCPPMAASPVLAMEQATPTFGLFSTAEGGAAYMARDLLEISSHIFKPDVRLLSIDSAALLCCL